MGLKKHYKTSGLGQPTPLIKGVILAALLKPATWGGRKGVPGHPPQRMSTASPAAMLPLHPATTTLQIMMRALTCWCVVSWIIKYFTKHVHEKAWGLPTTTCDHDIGWRWKNIYPAKWMGHRRIPTLRAMRKTRPCVPARVGLSCVQGADIPNGALQAHIDQTYGAVRGIRPPRTDRVISCSFPTGRIWRATRHTGTTWGEFHRRLARQMNEAENMFRIRHMGEFVDLRATIPPGTEWVDLEHRHGQAQEHEGQQRAERTRERSRSRDREEHAGVEENETLYIFYTDADQVWRLPMTLEDLQREHWEGITAGELGRAIVRAYPGLFNPTERLIMAADINILRNTAIMDEHIAEADIGIVRVARQLEPGRCRRRRRREEDSSEETPPHRPAPPEGILEPGLQLLQPPHREAAVPPPQRVRPSVEEVFGAPPEGVPRVHGLPSPDHVLQGYFREIEERATQDQRLPMRFQRDLLRVMVVGAGPNYAMEVRWKDPTITLGQMRMLSRTHGVLENRQAHFARINGEKLQENVQYEIEKENVWWMIYVIH